MPMFLQTIRYKTFTHGGAVALLLIERLRHFSATA